MDPSAASQFLRILLIAFIAIGAAPLAVLFAEGFFEHKHERGVRRRRWRLAFG